MPSGFLVFLWLLAAYVLLVWFLARRGILAKYNIGLWGPALMLKTTRGRDAIEWLAKPRRAWNAFAAADIVITLALMVVLVGFLVWLVPQLASIPAEAAPRASQILALPGINPLIPLWYGLLALILAIVLHEFGHGILARANDLRVKSLGLLLFIVPIGAFVEPDEEELKATKKRARMRVYAAGVSMNLATTALFGLLLSGVLLAAAEPRADGVGIVSVEPDSPADQAGVERAWILTAIGEQPVRSGPDFFDEMCGRRPGERVALSFHEHGTRTVTLADRADFVESDAAPSSPEENPACPQEYGEAFLHKGFLGVSPLDHEAFLATLRSPFRDRASMATYVALPFFLRTFHEPVTSFYDTPFAPQAFWITANVVYWVFWISLMLGLTNALPAVPLDGGFLFRDAVDEVVKRLSPGLSAASRARAVKTTSVTVSLLVLVLILLQLIVPRLGGLT